MNDNVYTKCFIAGIILLFFGASVVLAINNNVETAKSNDEIVTSGFDDGLVGYWSFDEGSGSIAYDESGNDNDGTIHGALWVKGISGNALDFDGVDDYVDVSDVNDFYFSDESLTFAAWIQIVNNDNKYHAFIELGDAVDGYPHISLGKFRSCRFDNGRLFAEIYPPNPGGPGAYVYSIDNGVTLPKNTWIFLVSVIDYENSLFKLYLDGVFQDSDELVAFDMSAADLLKLYIGNGPHNDPYWPNHHNGLIDEVRIYNKVLSEDEIQELYNDPFKMSFMFGRISNLNTGTGNRITFEAEKIRCIQFSPFQFIQYSSHEEIMVLDKYFGILNPGFICGFFKANV